MRKHQQALELAAGTRLAVPAQRSFHSGDFGRWERELRRSRMRRSFGRAILDGLGAYGALWVPAIAPELRK